MSHKQADLPSRRSNVARGMIVSGTGIKQIFRDKRDRRKKDYKNSWQADHRNNS